MQFEHQYIDRGRITSVERFHQGLKCLLQEESCMKLHPAMQIALAHPIDITHNQQSQAHFSNTITEETIYNLYLDALASCLVHDDLILPIATHLRPFLVDLIVRLMDTSITIYEPLNDSVDKAMYYKVVSNSEKSVLELKECTEPMKRSEWIASALTNILILQPQTLNFALQFFTSTPCFFNFISITNEKNEESTLYRLRRISRTAYRLVDHFPHHLTTLWNWSSFYSLCYNKDVEVRWYAARTTAALLQMTITQRLAFINKLNVGGEIEIKDPVVRSIASTEHRYRKYWTEIQIKLSALSPEVGTSQIIYSELTCGEPRTMPLHRTLSSVFGIIVPTNSSSQNSLTTTGQNEPKPLIATGSTKHNLQSLAIALGLSRPILVAGPSGCGKTAMIRELSRKSNNGELVELHLDDQIDSKTLLGTFVCTDIPGEFTWQPGALTTAVINGRWVLIEDIDRAPFEVLAAIMPLLEVREINLPGRSERLVAHQNFQIFATTTNGHNMPKGFQSGIWTRVDIHPMNDAEMRLVLRECFKQIPCGYFDKIMETYYMVSGKLLEGGINNGNFISLWREVRHNYGREFSLRDLLKWCNRITKFCCNGYDENNSDKEQFYVTEEQRLNILIEAHDIFCAGIRDPKHRLAVSVAIGVIWEVPEAKISHQFLEYRPNISANSQELAIGRVHMSTISQRNIENNHGSKIVMTNHVLRLLEQLAAVVVTGEPVLLVGETGCGKTTIIQQLAAALGQNLVVQNLNIQTDTADLVGGFQPVEIHLLARPLYMKFVDLFADTFSAKNNSAFLSVVHQAFENKQWKKLKTGMAKAVVMAKKKIANGTNSASPSLTLNDTQRRESESPVKRSRVQLNDPYTGTAARTIVDRWDSFESDLIRFGRQMEQVESHFAFSFVEGVLVQALRNGHWVLLDEINLASADVLERIGTLIEQETSSFSITERGDVEAIRPHPNFRIFGAMNPSTDVGKKDLSLSLRNRFTEIYVDECESPSDLQMVVSHLLRDMISAPVSEIVSFYLHARKLSHEKLSDGSFHRPRYSLRTLCQALEISRVLVQRGYGLDRALFEGFVSCFCTSLDSTSRSFLESVIKKAFARNIKVKDLSRAPSQPGGRALKEEFVLVASYWLQRGAAFLPRDDSIADPITNQKKFVLTKSVEENLRHLARAALIGKYPVLLQGPTSGGKTSLIFYLAARVGQKCVRINNHEHTDIQEYLGSYVADSGGKLVFKEGVLVEALRKGWWIILDELNLAPSEVLEALNRLLDDNRELFIPETQEYIKPHPMFMLFATQNPPGLYGGRKVLSRAFRNRFLEIQIDEVSPLELQSILQERSSLPPSYCAILIDVMKQLQLIRHQSSVFSGKAGFITTRDLLRWAERRPLTKQSLAEEGFCLLAERLRKDDEKLLVKRVIEEKCNVTIDVEVMYCGIARKSNLIGEEEFERVWGSNEQFEKIQQKINYEKSGDLGRDKNAAGLHNISITKSLRRLFSLVGRCLQHKEPVLLVGETGCGKTTVCQLYSLLFSQKLHILNCHQHTESSDFLGCLRPVRGKDKIYQELRTAILHFFSLASGEENDSTTLLMGVNDLVIKYDSYQVKNDERTMAYDDDRRRQLENHQVIIENLKRRFQAIFEWSDGPLVESMREGDLFLIDEINLAEDAVLERLNSVLEPTRAILLAEKGGESVEELVAHENWRVMATMNPGGDFGKRELSPALRNRFTEIWVPSISDMDDIATIIRDRLCSPPSFKLPQSIALKQPEITALCQPMIDFVQQFNAANAGVTGSGSVTLRDILTWVNFIVTVFSDEFFHMECGAGTIWTAFVQGVAMAVLDGLGLGSDKSLHSALKARNEAYKVLQTMVPDGSRSAFSGVLTSINSANSFTENTRIDMLVNKDNSKFGIPPFMIPTGPIFSTSETTKFSIKAPTTLINLHRILRAMQVNRPILLEGSPGVGKTSLVNALAVASGHRLVRINLSEQTDITDLFGTDLPVPASASEADDNHSETAAGKFAWCDGVFLSALKNGDWVLLDELNLASQSVLEGLNSCFDHRGRVYIPELGREFDCPHSFRVFAAQNPLRQGGGRKGLPKSFINRFSRVFVDALNEEDMIHISSSTYRELSVITCPSVTSFRANVKIPVPTLVEKITLFNAAIHEDTVINGLYGRVGGPWDFNLRDVFRFCDLLKSCSLETEEQVKNALAYHVNFIYLDRMRTIQDQQMVTKRFFQYFGFSPVNLSPTSFYLGEKYLQIGNAYLKRAQLPDQKITRLPPPIMNFLLTKMESLVHCVNNAWPALLVGPSACGKTSCVRLLAALSGNILHEIGMSAATDATELLGCFEQVDIGRKLRSLVDRTEVVYYRLLSQVLMQALELISNGSSDNYEVNRLTNTIIQISAAWWNVHIRQNEALQTNFEKAKGCEGFSGSKLNSSQLNQALLSSLSSFLNLMNTAAKDIDWQYLAMLDELLRQVSQTVKLSTNTSLSTSFEWVDGILIKAMENGHWVLIDNANFCSSSVLDRLNSLMEVGGELLVNEAGAQNGRIRLIKPHPSFRIFLAMDPQFGEVSRAMRNRCIEIAFANHNDLPLDLITIASRRGIPGFDLCQAFQLVHEQVKSKNTSGRLLPIGHVNKRHFEQWVFMAASELARGMDAYDGIMLSFNQIYGDNTLDFLSLRDQFLSLFSSAFHQSNVCPIQQSALPLKYSAVALAQNPEFVQAQYQFLMSDYIIECRKKECKVTPTIDYLMGSLEYKDPQIFEGDASAKDYRISIDENWRKDLAKRLTTTSWSFVYDIETLREAQKSLYISKMIHETNEMDALGSVSLSLAFRQFIHHASFLKGNNNMSAKVMALIENSCSRAHFTSDFPNELLHSILSSELLDHLINLLTINIQKMENFLGYELSHLPKPVFFFANQPFIWKIEAAIAMYKKKNPSNDLIVNELWASILNIQIRLQLLRDCEWTRYFEEKLYKMVDSSVTKYNTTLGSHQANVERFSGTLHGHASSYVTLQQSYALSVYRITRSVPEIDVLSLIYPFLKSCNVFFNEFLKTNDVPNETISLVKEFMVKRYDFSMQLLESRLDWTKFLIHWQWTKKSVLRIEKVVQRCNDLLRTFSWLKEFRNVMDMTIRVQDSIDKYIGCKMKKNTLWKYGGHAFLPREKDLWGASYNMMQLSTAQAVITPKSSINLLNLLFSGEQFKQNTTRIFDISPVLYCSKTYREDVLHAMCTFSYINHQLLQKNTDDITSHAILPDNLNALTADVLKLYEVLKNKLAKQKQVTTDEVSNAILFLSEPDENEVGITDLDLLQTNNARNSRNESPIILFNLKEYGELLQRLIDFQLSPISEHTLLRMELQVIALMLKLWNEYSLSIDDAIHISLLKELAYKIQALLLSVDILLERLLKIATRDPVSYHGYKDLIWAGYEFIHLEDHTNMLSNSDILRSKCSLFMRHLQSHFSGLLAGFHKFLRLSGCNNYDATQLGVYNSYASEQRKYYPDKKDSQFHQVHGLPKLFQCGPGAVALKYVEDLNLYNAKCSTVELPLYELRLKQLREVMIDSTFLFENAEAGLHQVSSLHSYIQELFVSTIVAFKRTFFHAKDQWEFVRQYLSSLGFEKGRDNQSMKLVSALKASSDETFRQSVDTFVQPYLIIEEPEAKFEPLCLGEKLILVGLWRFELVMPTTPLDPTMKPLIKKEMLQNRLAMLTLEDAIEGACDRVYPRATSTRDALNKDNDILGLINNINNVAVRAVQRFQAVETNSTIEIQPVKPSTFKEFFDDLHRFQTTVFSQMRIMHLLGAIKQTLSSNASRIECERVLQEISMLHEISNNFLAQVHKKYGFSYKDVIEPLEAAVYCTLEGFSFLEFAINERAQLHDSSNCNNEAIINAIIRYPTAVNYPNQSAAKSSTTLSDIGILLNTVRSRHSSILIASTKKNDLAIMTVALSKLNIYASRLFYTVRNSSTTNALNNAREICEALACANSIFELFINKWNEQQEAEAKRRKEEEELYKHKVRHLDIDTDDQLEYEEYRQQFPDYALQDFKTFLPPEESQDKDFGMETSSKVEKVENGFLLTDSVIQMLCKVHMRLYASNACSQCNISSNQILHSFSNAIELAVMMAPKVNTIESFRLEQQLATSTMFAASIIQSRIGSTDFSGLPESLASGDYTGNIDFHRDPYVKEVILVSKPLQDFMLSVQKLLKLWPEHAILQQLMLIADRIRNFEISSPLARTLTGVELLLRKAQEWEKYASKEYSISQNLGELSRLVTRWRKLELSSWPYLLLVKEKEHQKMAQKTWISLYSLLTANYDIENIGGKLNIDIHNVKNKDLQWLHLSTEGYWLFPNADVLSTSSNIEKNRIWMTQLFDTLDSYIRSCSVGQYETRLFIIYSLCTQLYIQYWSFIHDSTDNSMHQLKYKLANILYHLFRYYSQHLSYLSQHLSGLKAPIQQKLLEFVRICRWDEQTYYSLAESAEKSHRKLMKFVHDYDVVLNVNTQAVIDGAIDSGVSNENGYMGLSMTKKLLDSFSDGIIVPEISTSGENEQANSLEEPSNKCEENGVGSDWETLRLIHQISPTNTHIELLGNLPQSIVNCLEKSRYIAKLPVLTGRISTYTMDNILHPDQIGKRQQTREICNNLCEAIFYRLAMFQKDVNTKKIPRGAKQKALVDLLRELKNQGLSHLQSQLPQEQFHVERLFELDAPNVENCLMLDGFDELLHFDENDIPSQVSMGKNGKQSKKGNKKTKRSKQLSTSLHKLGEGTETKSVINSPTWLWNRADAYYYRFLTQIIALRYSAKTQYSHDLSRSEVDKMGGFAENMLYRILRQRQILHAMCINHEHLISALDRLENINLFYEHLFGESKVEATIDSSFQKTYPPQMSIDSVLAWHSHQRSAVISVKWPIEEMQIAILTMLQTYQSNSPNAQVVAEVKKLFDCIAIEIQSIEICFNNNSKTKHKSIVNNSFGVPGVPLRGSIEATKLLSQARKNVKYLSTPPPNDESLDPLVEQITSPKDRVYGISPYVSNLNSRKENLWGNNVTVSYTQMKCNSQALQRIYKLLSQISKFTADIVPSSCMKNLINSLHELIKQDNIFASACSQYDEDVTTRVAAISVNNIEHTVAQEFMNDFLCVFDQLVDTILVAIQDLTIKKTELDAMQESSEDNDGAPLSEVLRQLLICARNSRINQISSQLVSLLGMLQNHSQSVIIGNSGLNENNLVFCECLRLIKLLEPSLLHVRNISRQLIYDWLIAHKSVAKLDFILVRLFRTLFQHGYCRSAEEDSEGKDVEGAGKMKFEDDVEGTGMGEGEGKKDVSNEIEDEEQLLGLRDDQQRNSPPPNKTDQPDESGLEMQNDFEGAMQDLPDDEDKSDNDNSDDEEELDREMGDFNQDDENVVDEKMWGEDSDDDEDNIDKENEKFENDSKVDGKAIEDEIRGKESDEEDVDNKNETKNEEKDSAKDKQLPPVDETLEEDFDMENDSKDVNDDLEDNYEDHHDGADPQSKEEEGKENEQEFPEDMNLDQEQDENACQENENDPDGDVEMDDVESEQVNENDETENALSDEQDKGSDIEEDEISDSAVQMGSGNLEEEQTAEDSAQADDEEAKTEEESKEETPEQPSNSNVVGTQALDGKDDVEYDENNDEENKSKPDLQDIENVENDRDGVGQQQSDSSHLNYELSMEQEHSSSTQEDIENRRERRMNEPNPYRNPDDAREHWKKRVEIVDTPDENKMTQKTDLKDKEEKVNNDIKIAELQEDQDMEENSELALAPANECQTIQQNNLSDEETNDENDDDDIADDFSENAMEIDSEGTKKPLENDEKQTSSQRERQEISKEKEHKNEAEDLEKPPSELASEEGRKNVKTESMNHVWDVDNTIDERNETQQTVQSTGLHLSDNNDEIMDMQDVSEDNGVSTMSIEQITKMREDLDDYISQWSQDIGNGVLVSRGAELWSKYTSLTSGSSQRLSQQLRLVLEPMLRAKLEGDYRTGKRINMRKIIPYIASQYRKDKIWMRRTKPSKRQYQVMIAIDDSESMADNHAGRLALEAMTTLCKSMTQLEVGSISVVKFGETVELLHAFDTPFTDDVGCRIITQFSFNQKKTHMVHTLEAILRILDSTKISHGSQSIVEFTQIVFLVSDGRFDTDGRTRIKKLIESGLEKQQLIVLLIVDDQSNKQGQNSILETKSVTFNKGKVEMVSYLEKYPFPYYVVLPQSTLLPEILCDSLRQWFEMLQMKR